MVRPYVMRTQDGRSFVKSISLTSFNPRCDYTNDLNEAKVFRLQMPLRDDDPFNCFSRNMKLDLVPIKIETCF